MSSLRSSLDRGIESFEQLVGGEKRALVLVLLAGVLALETADTAMIGAVASKLEHALSLNNTKLGLLAAIPAGIAAFATIPIGMATDRINRVRLTAASAVVWAVAMILSGLSGSYGELLIFRVALGAATATAGPAVASLVGDLFSPNERGRMYGIILSGEILGAGIGFVVSGLFASFSWRVPFFIMAIPSAALSVALVRFMREPARGGAGQLEPKTEKARRLAEQDHGPTAIQRQVSRRHVEPNPRLVLHRDPVHMSMWRAGKYVLSLRSNVILIIASALGYFYLTGIETFGLEYLKGHFGISQAEATLVLAVLLGGGLVGVLLGGRLSDRMIHGGRLNGRIVVAGTCSLVATACFVPALLSSTLLISIPLLVLAAACLTAVNPSLDSARLDLVHHRLWGRAEAVRTFLRQTLVASSPVLFGFVADALVTSRTHNSGDGAGGGGSGFGANASARGLQLAFLILLITLLIGGLLTLRARRDFPTDVATAAASEEATRDSDAS